MKTLARTRLVEERKGHQWSQQELADLLGTTQHNVSRWERGQTIPNAYFRAKLCELFGKNAQELGLVKEHVLLPITAVKATSDVVSADSSPTDVLALSTIPYPHNQRGTAHVDLLGELDREGHDDPTMALRATLPQQQMLKGQSAIGKAQIAVDSMAKELVVSQEAQGRVYESLPLSLTRFRRVSRGLR